MQPLGKPTFFSSGTFPLECNLHSAFSSSAGDAQSLLQRCHPPTEAAALPLDIPETGKLGPVCPVDPRARQLGTSHVPPSKPCAQYCGIILETLAELEVCLFFKVNWGRFYQVHKDTKTPFIKSCGRFTWFFILSEKSCLLYRRWHAFSNCAILPHY